MSDRWDQPQGANTLEVAFPAEVTGRLLPPIDEVPGEFHGGNEWTELVDQLFFRGGTLPEFREGIDPGKAVSQIRACLGSFEPEHEHKTAGVAYLLSLWCKSAKGGAR